MRSLRGHNSLTWALWLATAIGAGALLWAGPMWLLIVVAAWAQLGAPIPTVWVRCGRPVPPAQDDLPRRRIVWNALSELYLDTELDRSDHRRIAREIRRAGYTVDEADQVLFAELHGVLIWNLWIVAGEWAGFDEEWLEQRLVPRSRAIPNRAVVFSAWMVAEPWGQTRSDLSALNSQEVHQDASH